MEAFLAVVQRGEIGKVYNIGCDEGAELAVMEVALMVVALVHGLIPGGRLDRVRPRPALQRQAALHFEF